MRSRSKSIYVVAVFFGFALPVFAWGGAEHVSITSAAVSALSPAILVFLGSELKRLVKHYCNYPDINWAVYGTCAPSKGGDLRIPDLRRDFNASYYCDFDEFTGRGGYSGHGPEIGKEMPPPDEHSRKMYERRDFASASARKFFLKCDTAFRNGHYFDAVRFLGVVLHYIEDSTPPPHTLSVPGGSNALHHQMEAIADHSRIRIDGYAPRMLATTREDAAAKVAELSDVIACEAQRIARRMLTLIESGRSAEAEASVVDCANMAAKAAADVIYTLHELHKDALPVRPLPTTGRNLLFNPSFDEDGDGDLQPDGWVREWGDLKCPFDMHLWDRVSPGSGACVRLYGVPAGGASWRTARAFAVPVVEERSFSDLKLHNRYEKQEIHHIAQGGPSARQTARPMLGGTAPDWGAGKLRIVLKGRIRLQCATGESYLALRFLNADYETLSESRSELMSGKEFWKDIAVTATAPDGAVDVLAVCGTRGNTGSVLFDELDLRLLPIA